MTFATERLVRPRTDGWIRYLNQRMPGETPHLADDFFNDGDHSTWTLIQITGTTTPTERYGVLSLLDVGTTSRDLNGMAKSIGGLTAPLTLETAFRWVGAGAIGAGTVSLGFTDGIVAASNSVVVNVFAETANTAWSAGTLTQFDTAAVNHYSRGNRYSTSHMYLRIVWKAVNTFRIAFSPDGVSWVDLGGDHTPTITPTHLMLGVSAYGSSPTVAGFEYLRVYDADLIT